MSKFFRFACRTIPSESAIKTDSFKNESVYTEVCVDEMNQFNLTRMPLYIDHESGIEVSKKVPNQPITIKASGKSLIGCVVDTFVTDNHSMINIVEIPLTDDTSTDVGLATDTMKRAVISLIKSGDLGSVSLCHVNDNNYDTDANIEVIKKIPLELSLTNNPIREGSHILSSYYSDIPYLPDSDYKRAFRAEESASVSGIDFLPMVNDIKNKNIQEKSPDDTSIQQDPAIDNTNDDMATAPPKAAFTQEDFNKFMQEHEALKKKTQELEKQNAELEPMAREFTKKKKEEHEGQKANFIKAENTILEQTKALLEALSANKIDIAPEDKPIFDQILATTPPVAEQQSKEMESLLLQEKRMNPGTNPLNVDDAYKAAETAFARISGNIVACSRVCTSYLNKIIDVKNKTAAMNAAAAAAGGSATGAASTKVASVAAGNEPVFHGTFDHLKKTNDELRKQIYANANDAPSGFK